MGAAGAGRGKSISQAGPPTGEDASHHEDAGSDKVAGILAAAPLRCPPAGRYLPPIPTGDAAKRAAFQPQPGAQGRGLEVQPAPPAGPGPVAESLEHTESSHTSKVPGDQAENKGLQRGSASWWSAVVLPSAGTLARFEFLFEDVHGVSRLLAPTVQWTLSPVLVCPHDSATI
jgi:hypothetical protein